MKHTFYAPPESISGDTVFFPEDEAHHASRVLRIASGDEAIVVDGDGGWYRVEITVRGKRDITGRILERRSLVGEAPYDLTVGIGLIKHAGRFETFVEKAVELGAGQIIPLITKRSEKSRFKSKRADAIVSSAMKQSGRSKRTVVSEPAKFHKWIRRFDRQSAEFRAICHEKAPLTENLISLLGQAGDPQELLILIGPEGGFTEEEIQMATEAGFSLASLGPRRLRTETAGTVAAAAVMLNAEMRPAEEGATESQ